MTFSFESDEATAATAESVSPCPVAPVSSIEDNPSKPSRLSTPLTTDDSKVSTLPSELRESDGSSMSWGKARERYSQHIAGERANDEYSNTFESRARKRYAEILDSDRHFRREFSECHIGHFSLTGQPKDQSGRWIPPLEYVERLTDSLEYVTRTLRRTFDDRRFGWYAVLAATPECSLPHWHFVVYTEGEHTPDELQRAQSKHSKYSPVALESNHTIDSIDVESAESLSLEPIGERDNRRGKVAPVARYVAGQLPHLRGNTSRRFGEEHGALMWAYSGQSFRSGGEFSKATTTEYDRRESTAGDEKESHVTPCVVTTVSSDDADSSDSIRWSFEHDDDAFPPVLSPRSYSFEDNQPDSLGRVWSFDRDDEPPGGVD